MKRTPFIEGYIQGLILVAFAAVVAWTALASVFTVLRWAELARGSTERLDLLAELSGPLMAGVGALMAWALWRLFRFMRRRGAIYGPE